MSRASAKYTITAEDKTKSAFKSVKSGLGGLGKAALSVKSALAAVVGVGGGGDLPQGEVGKLQGGGGQRGGVHAGVELELR